MSDSAVAGTPPAAGISNIAIEEELKRSYLDYAMSVIVSRALPDARDGLKPVHRRILFSMHENGNDWNKHYRKAARIVGDVIGKYHPHGDQAVYDALVRLAQDFAQRYPLVDGQGNFGNVDGDNPAAMRYTEARLTQVAHLLLDGIEEDAIDFRPTYDGSEKEPVVLPGAFPNLLANGSQGIAVGMATAIPPHNAAEICDAFREEVDEVVCATTPQPFYAVGIWYENFSQTTDQEVRDLLAQARAWESTRPGRETTKRPRDMHATPS